MGAREDLAKIERNLDASVRARKEGIRAALYLVAQKLMRRSIALTPVDTGRLRATAFVALPQDSGGKFTCRMGYGTNYAVYVHELNNRHRPPTSNKYLATALREASSTFKADITKYAKNAIATGQFVGSGGAMPTEPHDPGAAAQRATKRRSRKGAKK